MIHQVRDMNINSKAVMPTHTSQLSITEVHPRHSHLPSADCRFFNICFGVFFFKLQKVFEKNLLHKSKQKLFCLFWWKNSYFIFLQPFFLVSRCAPRQLLPILLMKKSVCFIFDLKWVEMGAHPHTHIYTTHTCTQLAGFRVKAISPLIFSPVQYLWKQYNAASQGR